MTTSLLILCLLGTLCLGANVTFSDTKISAHPSTTYHFRDIITSVSWTPGSASMKFLYFGTLTGSTLVATGVTCDRGSCTFSGSLDNPEVVKEIILGVNYTTPSSGSSQILFKGGDGTSSFEYMLHFDVPDTTPTTSDALIVEAGLTLIGMLLLITTMTW
jgi:hypothetical protein